MGIFCFERGGMKNKDLEFLCCPKCGGDLDPFNKKDASIKDIAVCQKIQCTRCSTKYAVQDGIPLLSSGAKSEEVAVVTDTFGKRWTENYKNMIHTQHHYIESLAPLTPADFKGKIIIDGGCGFGPLSKFLLDCGAQHVICIDYSKAIFRAQQFLNEYKDRVTFVFGDILQPPIKPVCDMFISHGVLIRVEDAKKAYCALSQRIKPKEGTSAVWVYAKENNAFLRKAIIAIRTVTIKLPFEVNWWLAYVVEFLLGLMVNCFYRPMEFFFGVGRKLWFGIYFLDCLYNPSKGGTRKYRYNMIHDVLCTPIANHFLKEELKGWVTAAGYRSWNFMFYRKQSWSVVASYQQKNWNQGNDAL